MSASRPFFAVLVLTACVICAVAARGQVAAGAASGNLTVNGQTVAMAHAYAYLQTPTSGDGPDLVLVLSDRPLPASVLRNEDALVELSTKGEFAGVRVIVGKGGKDKSGMPFHKSLKAIISTGLFVHSDITGFDGKTVQGNVQSGKAELMGQTWEYDLTFNANVLPVK